MKEKLSNMAFFGFFVALEFWPLVVIPVACEAAIHWNFQWSSTGYIVAGTIGGYLLWDLCAYLADAEDESMSLVFGWRKRHPKRSYGYSAD